jgi:hypothetical protein
MNTLKVDQVRWVASQVPSEFPGSFVLPTGRTSEKFIRLTSIYVRAQNPDTQRWDSIDIALLDTDSLIEWLTSRGGDNPWAENCVLLMLGHNVPYGGPHQVVE